MLDLKASIQIQTGLCHFVWLNNKEKGCLDHKPMANRPLLGRAYRLNVQNFTPAGFSENKIYTQKVRKLGENLNGDQMMYLMKYTLTLQFSI